MVAKKECGLIEKKESNVGTFTNFAQNDQALYSLHTYMMYLKFGFGRATTDTSIDIRHKKLSRLKAIKIVKKYDSIFPETFTKDYCNYFNMTKKRFFKILYKFINKDIFQIKNKKIILLDTI